MKIVKLRRACDRLWNYAGLVTDCEITQGLWQIVKLRRACDRLWHYAGLVTDCEITQGLW